MAEMSLSVCTSFVPGKKLGFFATGKVPETANITFIDPYGL
jgi:hypothetical protein